ncbi:glycosyltransferase family 2 protein [Candidatus Kaiserbacteria bacterium]|nr:glycosyltransferase family 2 protein [Candidatus Kaiserbacteria bacterium]
MQASIIIRAYNAEETLRRALASALTQDTSKESYEIVVVDDGSTDATASVVRSFTDERIRLIQQENRGLTGASNTGVKESRGDIVLFLDADDEILPAAISLFTRTFKHKRIDCAYGNYFEEYEGSRKLEEPSDPFKALNGAYAWRRSSLLREQGFSGDTIFPEYEILLRTWDRWQIMHVAEPVFIYSRSRESLTGSTDRVAGSLQKLRDMYPDRIEEIRKIRSYALE